MLFQLLLLFTYDVYVCMSLVLSGYNNILQLVITITKNVWIKVLSRIII